jgi:hypothetical protein
MAVLTRTLLLFLVVLLNGASWAQISNVTFVGSIIASTGDNYSYKLLVSDSNDIIRGYSITDISGPDETKNTVIGKISPSKKQITFHENRIIYTKSTAAPGEFCYLHANLKLVHIAGASSLKGSFKGYKEDGKTECASGKMTLVCAQDVLDKLMKIAGRDSTVKRKADSIIRAHKEATIVYEKEIPISDILKLSPGKSIDLICPSSSATIELWDSKTIDGDQITLMEDGMPLLENFTLTASHKVVPVQLAGKRATTLRLIALNEGAEPLNTARIRISSGGQEYYIDASTTVDKPIEITLRIK